MAALLLRCIRWYQKWISPELPPGLCRMEPSCSKYGYEAVQTYGALQGVRMIWGRLRRCGEAARAGKDSVSDPVVLGGR